MIMLYLSLEEEDKKLVLINFNKVRRIISLFLNRDNKKLINRSLLYSKMLLNRILLYNKLCD
jgi:hypothetical protein